MTIGKGKYLWLLSAAALVILFLASSTDWLIKDREREVHPISVIIGDTTDENYVNYRKGMEQAALELHADVRFITLYSAGSWPQQLDLIQREERDGAEALIIAPVNAAAASLMLNQQLRDIPVVFLNGAPGETAEADNLAFDYHGLGEQTAEAIIKNHGTEIGVCLVGMEKADEASRQFQYGILGVLKASGCPVFLYSWNSEEEDSFQDVCRQLAKGGRSPKAVAALDPRTLLKLADSFSEDGMEETLEGRLYGRGTSVQILNHLGRGRIKGLCITDDFTAGYLSVECAVNRIRNQSSAGDMVLHGAYIEQTDLRLARYEKMLYPIE